MTGPTAFDDSIGADVLRTARCGERCTEVGRPEEPPRSRRCVTLLPLLELVFFDVSLSTTSEVERVRRKNLDIVECAQIVERNHQQL